MSNKFVGVLVVLGATVSAAAPTRFVYQSGYLEAHADHAMALGSSGVLALTSALESRLPLSLSYANVNLAGGGKTSATEYAKFLPTSRPAEETPSGKSVPCGRLIKKAYDTGQVR